MSTARRRQLWIYLASISVSIGILTYLIFGHVERLTHVVGSIDWRFAGLAFGCAIGSYFMMGLSLWEILSLLGYARPFPVVLGITFVSNTANYLISSAGVSGFALKAHLLRKRQVPYGVTVMAAVLSTVLMYLVLAVLIAQGLVYLILHIEGAELVLMEGFFGLGVLAITAVPILMFLFHRRVRGKMTRFLYHTFNRVTFNVSKREIPREDFAEFEQQLEEGLVLIGRSKTRLSLAIGYICLDWIFAMMVLFYGLRAVGFKMHVGALSTGFAVGQAAALIPFLPGGLGAMEGAMVVTLESLGVDWDAALMAVLLYRAAYYVLPGIFSIFLYWGLRVSEPELLQHSVSEIPRDSNHEKGHAALPKPGQPHSMSARPG